MDKKYTKNSEVLNDMPVENQPTKDFLYFLWDLLKTGIVVFIIAFAIRYFLIQPFVVEGSSMMPNFIDTEYLLAEKLSYSLAQPDRGDVVIFKYPQNPSVNFIKRVIGLPGETVTIENNTVKIINNNNPNGFVLNESKYLPSGVQTITGEKVYSITLKDNEYFVMGDNREHSSDSREWGILPKANIIGRAWLIIKPLDKFGIEHRISYSGT
jgi:signal peptidase I